MDKWNANSSSRGRQLHQIAQYIFILEQLSIMKNAHPHEGDFTIALVSPYKLSTTQHQFNRIRASMYTRLSWCKGRLNGHLTTGRGPFPTSSFTHNL